jgi:hypothetical protein
MKRIILSAAALLLAVVACPAQSKAGTDRVQLKHDEANQRVDVLVEGKPFTSYLYPGPNVIKKPVLYPILTAQGTPITRGFPMEPRAGERVDHPHHVGMWLNYGDVNGHDFWNNSNAVGDHPGPFGTIVHKSVKTMKGGKDRGELTVTADWLDKDGKLMLQETTTYYFGGTGNARTIDRITTLKALGQDVLFKDNKEGMVAIRVRRELEHPSSKPEVFTDASGKATDVPTMNNEGVTGRYRSSEGVEGEDVWGKRAKWMNLTGKVGNENISVAILDHPQNVGYPTYWHSRGYGLYAANTLGWKAMSNGKEELNYKLPAGKSVTFRYRVVVTSGQQADAQLNAEAEKFAKAK